jgi:hypothetical protein
MKKILLVLFLLIPYAICFSQSKNKGGIGVSIPVIWNNSEATYYQASGPRTPSGSAISFGTTLEYNKKISKKIFVEIGIGFYRQLFGIKRPFYYVTPDSTKPIIYTTHYFYDNLHFLIGCGYYKKVWNNSEIQTKMIFNIYNSFRQRYAQTYFPGINEVYKKSLNIGGDIMYCLGLEKHFGKKISLGGTLNVPIYTFWKSDPLFYNLGYSATETRIAKNRFSMGLSLTVYYSL